MPLDLIFAYLFFAFITAYLGHRRGMQFITALLVSLLATPIIGVIVAINTDSDDSVKSSK